MTAKLTDFEESIRANWPDQWYIAPGVSPSCPDCQRDYGMEPRAFYAAYENGEIADEPGFSWRACDSCGSTLGGDRYTAHALQIGANPADPAVHHIGICVDCLMYHANGDLPEEWEG